MAQNITAIAKVKHDEFANLSAQERELIRNFRWITPKSRETMVRIAINYSNHPDLGLRKKPVLRLIVGGAA